MLTLAAEINLTYQLMQSFPVISSTTRILTLTIIGAYIAATLTIGMIVRRRGDSASRFLHARASLPVFITSLAVLASNCGALEIVGIFAATARYGLAALHFYWLGAIPAILFLSLFMMPIYLRSGAMTVPDLLRLRYNKATHILTCLALVTMMVFIAGISLYAISSVLNMFFGWSFFHVALTAAGIVLGYVLLGGLRATIYSEVLQLTLTIVGLIPLAWMVHRDIRGFQAAWDELPFQMRHLWSGLPFAAPQSSSLDIFGSVFGLGFILASAYWCTDFVLIQRALAAKTDEGSINTPLLAAIPKMLFPVLTVFPALTLTALAAKSKTFQFDLSLPMLMESHYGPYLLSLGIAAILASLMSGLAGTSAPFQHSWLMTCTRDISTPARQTVTT